MVNFFKVCICGDSEVGKTTLTHQYLKGRFKSNAERTIGSNFFIKRFKLPETKTLLTLQGWDLAGQEHFRWVRNAFYKGAKGIVYVYDLTRKDTFESLYNWKEEVEEVLGVVPNILVGNKVDLLNPISRVAKNEEIIELKKLVSANDYFETSAKIGTNVNDVFQKLSLLMYKTFNK